MSYVRHFQVGKYTRNHPLTPGSSPSRGTLVLRSLSTILAKPATTSGYQKVSLDHTPLQRQTRQKPISNKATLQLRRKQGKPTASPAMRSPPPLPAPTREPHSSNVSIPQLESRQSYCIASPKLKWLDSTICIPSPRSAQTMSVRLIRNIHAVDFPIGSFCTTKHRRSSWFTSTLGCQGLGGLSQAISRGLPSRSQGEHLRRRICLSFNLMKGILLTST